MANTERQNLDNNLEKHIRFQPQEGPQTYLFKCPADEILFGGARGGGKSFGVLGLFDWHQIKYGRDAKGIIFRRTFPELEDIINKAKEIFCNPKDPNCAVYNETKKKMTFPGGATLLFRFIENLSDHEKYQGHEYTFIVFEEAGNWESPVFIDKLKACLRSAAKVQKRFVLTANPGGIGNDWLAERFVDVAPPLTLYKHTEKVMLNGKPYESTTTRCYIPAKVQDNKILLDNDPNYLSNIIAATQGNSALRKAWLEGDWHTVRGGMFTEVWNPEHHIIPPFDIPHHWPVYRAYDWGSSRPFSVGYWTVTDGGYIPFRDGSILSVPKKTLIRVGEYYGCVKGRANEGLKLLESQFLDRLYGVEESLKSRLNIDKIRAGPADDAIFVKYDGISIAEKHAARGIVWYKAKKGPGSRAQGAEAVRQALGNTNTRPIEHAGILVTSDCKDFIRILPKLKRDDNKPDQVDENAEDHIYDETSYFVRWISSSMAKKIKVKGL